jgi:hypothetical protein
LEDDLIAFFSPPSLLFFFSFRLVQLLAGVSDWQRKLIWCGEYEYEDGGDDEQSWWD